MVKDLAERRKFPLHACFVDFSKAFDSVYWDAILQELSYWHAPKEFIDMAFSVMIGHVLRVRSDGELGEGIPVGVGVLQGDTLAPYLFITVLDRILRGMPKRGILLSQPAPKPTKRQEALICTVQETRMSHLAYADDVCIMANTAADLQIMFSYFEQEALKVGLRVNMGAGKTERIVIGSDPGRICTQTNKEVPIVKEYKYLGVKIVSPEADMARRKGCAWAALKRCDDIWKSRATMNTKRQLFRALVEPILSYGLCARPMGSAILDSIDSMYGRMLRYACGLPAAYISRDLMPTERLYGSAPFLSSQVLKLRMKIVLNAIHQHSTGIRQHLCALLAVTEIHNKQYPRKRARATGSAQSLQEQICRASRIEFPCQLKDVAASHAKKVLQEVATERQRDRWHTVAKRRVRKCLSNFTHDTPLQLEVPRPRLKENALLPLSPRDFRGHGVV
jgi:hypothetical protein